MITVELDNFSLKEICQSGQCFRMRETEENTYELLSLCGGSEWQWDQNPQTGSLGDDHYISDLAAEQYHQDPWMY